MKKIEEYMRSVPDFPKKGIIFRDMTKALSDKEGLKLTVDSLIDCIKDVDYDIIGGIESRGFILGMPIAYEMGKAFLPVRKKGKLPCETIEESYDLEYGSATIEIDKTAIHPGDKVVLIDDIIATGGTMKAACRLVERLGGEVVAILFLMELVDLKGRDVLSSYPVYSVIKYEGE